MTLERRDDPMRATQHERYGEDITEQVEESRFHQRVALVLSQVFHPVYKYLFAGRGHFVSQLEVRLAQAKVSTPVEIYLSNAIALGTLLGALVGGGLGVLTLALLGRPGLPETLAPPDTGLGEALGVVLSVLGHGLFVGSWLVLFGALGLLAGLAVAVYYPAMPIYQRRREVDLVLPDVVGFMYSLSVGGMDTLDIFNAVAESEDTYGEAAVEFQQITHEIEYFNVDYQTAVENVARTTPSDDLSKFLIDMLSVINSGGDLTGFLETEKEHQIDQRRRTQADLLNTLEVFGEVYISLTVLPLILIVVLVIMALLGDAQLLLLLVTVYVVLPALNAVYFLAVSVTIQDDVGTGRLEPADDAVAAVSREGAVRDLGVVDAHVRARPGERLLHRIRTEEFRHRISQLLADPLAFFRASPRYTLAVTVPLAVVGLAALFVQGVAEPGRAAMEQRTLTQSFVWFGMPFLCVASPLALFYEWRARTIASVTDTLTTDLRKLANANATGQPLLEAIRITGEDNNSRLGRELTAAYKRVTFGSSLGTVLVEFNNRYRIPRLARSVKLVQKAQETSDQITDVLTTAADLSEIQDDLEREKRTRTRMQVVIIAISFVVFVAVLLMLEEFFIETIVEVMGESPDAEFAEFGSLEPAFLSMLYLHAALIQGCCAGLISGYVQTGKAYTGLKYAIGFVAFTFLAWASVGVVF
jgi:flagellar protein FlaJ